MRLLTALLLLPLLAAPARAADPVADAPVELARYAGTWHEIARMPHFFQRKCARDVTATYTPMPGFVKVVNRCVEADGTAMSVEGKAFVTDAPRNRRLKVGFFEILGWMPFKGDYWVLALDRDYRWVIVGGPDRKYAWILARPPALDAPTRARIDDLLRANGYDPAALSAGAQPGGRGL